MTGFFAADEMTASRRAIIPRPLPVIRPGVHEHFDHVELARIPAAMAAPAPSSNACPEHPSRKIAEDWAETLRVHGYSAFVESQGDMSDVGGGAASDDNADLMSVRARMA
jgi:hypothetical protein